MKKFLKHGKMGINTEIKATMSYFDIKNALWEPLIEKIRLKYTQMSEKDIQIQLLKSLNINLTTEFLQSL